MEELTNKPYVPSGYKYWKNGWYFDFNKPSEAIKIPQAEYEQLVEGQSKGLQIKENDKGYPILVGNLLTEEERAALFETAKLMQQKRARLTSLSQDIVQDMAGEIVPNIEQRKLEFIALHNELRVLEGKQPRAVNNEI